MRRAASQWPVRAISRSSAHAHLCGRLIAHLCTCTCTCAVRIRYRHRLTVPSRWTGHRGLRASRFLVRGACHWFTRLAFVVRFVVLWLRLPFALLAVVAGHWSLVTGRRGSWFGVCVRVAFLTEYCVLAFVRSCIEAFMHSYVHAFTRSWDARTLTATATMSDISDDDFGTFRPPALSEPRTSEYE